MMFSVLIQYAPRVGFPPAVENRKCLFVFATRFLLANPLLMVVTVVSWLDLVGRWFGGAS